MISIYAKFILLQNIFEIAAKIMRRNLCVLFLAFATTELLIQYTYIDGVNVRKTTLYWTRKKNTRFFHHKIQ